MSAINFLIKEKKFKF